MVTTKPDSPSEDQLRIGLIAPPWVAVPPPLYGGTEVVVDQLARGLTELGHEVVLFTTGDATCPVSRRWFFPSALGTSGSPAEELDHVRAAYDELDDCDIIHDHTTLGPLWASVSAISTPLVATVHGEFNEETTNIAADIAAHVAVVAISHHQAATARGVAIARVIHHGVDAAAFRPGRGDGGYAAFIGRMHPDKGVHRAIRIARAAGKRLVIAAKMWEASEQRYFHDHVEPLLGDDAVYLGQVGGAAKAELLAGAEALINPIRWPEPFGLVMIESLAAGTPVLAFPEGAAPEIIDHCQTGFLCTDEADMVRHLGDVADLDRRDCRRSAIERFSSRRMVADHLALYRERVANPTLDLTEVNGAPEANGVHAAPAATATLPGRRLTRPPHPPERITRCP